MSTFVCHARSAYQAEEVMLAVGVTALVAFALTLFAFQTKIDFTMCSGALLVCLVCLIIFGIFAAIFPSKVSGSRSAAAILFNEFCLIDNLHGWSVSE